jgi:hypothetical protein
MYNSYSLLTSAVSGQRHVPAARYPQERTPETIGKEAGRVSELVWTERLEEKSFSSARDLTPVVKFVVRHNIN